MDLVLLKLITPTLTILQVLRPSAFNPSVISWLPNFSDFSFDTFATLVENVKGIPSVSSKLLNLNQDHSSK